MKKSNKERGITLVALIITIIVLIILAGITISIALGQNGIFKKSKKAVDEYQKASEREETEMDKALIYMGEKPEFNEEELKIGEAINANKYGQLVKGYNERISETGGWRLFYQDNRYTYLISNNLVSSYDPSEIGTLYESGEKVSTIGRKLNSMLDNKGFFTEGNTNDNIKMTAWLTDPDEWNEYTNEDALFAIGGPTVELYAASFDAAVDVGLIENLENEELNLKEVLGVEETGYSFQNSDDIWLSSDSDDEIYCQVNDKYWWLSSPSVSSSSSELYVYR